MSDDDLDIDICYVHRKVLAIFCFECDSSICAECINDDHLGHSFESLKARQHREFNHRYQLVDLTDRHEELLQRLELLDLMEGQAISLDLHLSLAIKVTENKSTCIHELETRLCDAPQTIREPKSLDIIFSRRFLRSFTIHEDVSPIELTIESLRNYSKDLVLPVTDVNNNNNNDIHSLPDSEYSFSTRKASSTARESLEADLSVVDSIELSDLSGHPSEKTNSAHFLSKLGLLYILTYYDELLCYDASTACSVAVKSYPYVTNFSVVNISSTEKKIVVIKRKDGIQKIEILSTDLCRMGTAQPPSHLNPLSDWVVSGGGNMFMVYDQHKCLAFDAYTFLPLKGSSVLPQRWVKAITQYFDNTLIVSSKTLSGHCQVTYLQRHKLQFKILKTWSSFDSFNFAATVLDEVPRNYWLNVLILPCEDPCSISVHILNKKESMLLSLPEPAVPLAILSPSTLLLQSVTHRSKLTIAKCESMRKFFLES